MRTQQSVAVVSGDSLPIRASGTAELQLRDVGMLSEIADALVLHDRTELVVYDLKTSESLIDRSFLPVNRAGVELTELAELKSVLPPLPMFNDIALNDTWLAVVQFVESRGGSTTRDELTNYMEREWSTIDFASRLAELSYAAKRNAAYYMPFEDGAMTAQGATVAVLAHLLRRFKDYRDAAIKEANQQLGFSEILVSPPFFLEIAVRNAARPEGVMAALRDIREDCTELRSVACAIASAAPAERVTIAAELDQQFEEIVKCKSKHRGRSVALDLLSIVPSALSGAWLTGIASLIKASGGVTDFASSLSKKKAMRIFQAIHTTSADLKRFYDELQRVYKNLAFSPAELHAYFEERRDRQTSGAERDTLESIAAAATSRVAKQFCDQFAQYIDVNAQT